MDWNKYATVNTVTFGPSSTWRGDGINFFAHGLFGWERLSPSGDNQSNGITGLIGGGMDLKIWQSLSFRLFEADYQWARENFAGNVSLNDPGLRSPEYNGVRLRTVWCSTLAVKLRSLVAAACSVQPSEVLVGEPVHATVTGSNFNPCMC